MNVSVIITTYNHPAWLQKVLWGFAAQGHRDFELVIADDGSGPETRETICRNIADTDLAIRHVWHADRGFRQCRILNKAIVKSEYDYLVFVDGDCVPRADFLEAHVALATPGRFLSGGIVRLPIDISRQITEDDIKSGRATDRQWLRKQGMTGKLRLLTPNPSVGAMLDAVTTTRPTFNGHNASAWKNDLLRVNGFDERMQHAGLDRELGERLANAGVRGMQIRHRAGCIHLDHSRDNDNEETWRRNSQIRDYTKASRSVSTDFGINHRKMAA